MAENVSAVPPLLDHIVIAAPDLEGLVADFEKVTGVRPEKGGSHEKLGTRNYLLTFGNGHYLEFLGIDENLSAPAGGRPFELDSLTEPKVSTWVLHPENPDEAVENGRRAGVGVGDLTPASRRKPDGDLLTWRLTPPLGGGLNGAIPFIIDWQDSQSPAYTATAQATLESFVVYTDDPDTLGGYLAALGTGVEMRASSECRDCSCQVFPCLGIAVSGPAGTWAL
ncbi:VOC family protein [Flaviflexus massiliensis]|uniref:VOC family protein n=1 Tax=Flaviflexus massiliensis TaxID=1522309 RepID=UPI0006D58B5F|nr:VOC family protein [Flaviflexus massiliensis]